ncbi:hypothetical protein QVD17_01186 [Tagetes erecta]|uniref:J domain-containing protein n=1 Tax=Tagetes erecta TaxID=13708 RepID=A0AAD8P6J3_TARER|nr:hypothetical protein QVD17_01186 [Tagetes erecta]
MCTSFCYIYASFSQVNIFPFISEITIGLKMFKIMACDVNQVCSLTMFLLCGWTLMWFQRAPSSTSPLAWDITGSALAWDKTCQPITRADEPISTPKMEAKLIETFDGDLKMHPKRSKTKDLDEQLDVSSPALALKKAIEKVQESIQIAKESVCRKKKGLESFSNKKFKDNFNGEGEMEDEIAATSSQVFADFMDVIDEINEKLYESSKGSLIRVMDETEPRPHGLGRKNEYAALSFDEVYIETTKTENMDFVYEDQTCNMFVDGYEGKVKVGKTEEGEEEPVERVEADVLRESKDEKDLDASQASNKKDNENKLTAVENETQDEVFDVESEEKVESENGNEAKNKPKDQEFYEKSAADDKVSGEIDRIYVASNIADVNENIVETTQEIDDVTKSMKEESNIQPPHKETPHIEYANEMKISQEPQYNDKEDGDKEPGSKVSEKDHFRRIYEEAAAKEREREKNRVAVEKAICEARDRASAEARERAERQRAAVEKAIEEARQRTTAEACRKVTKAYVANKTSSAQSKLRAERAPEKATSQKTDLNSSESALRTKAKLDKHNRIMERAAKVLAENEKRDQLAQKEQARPLFQRLAKNLDADIQRWSTGKEGDLRALLSTLQYILGPESGWKPFSLACLIATSDVKKAYRKATLCVHPDKLQQWGASIQHKYICEKVFILLKAAWKIFNSEERYIGAS